MTDALDWAKFNLDVMKTRSEIFGDYLKAVADYNYRMMEVLEKQVKVATDAHKLQQLKDAHAEYKEAVKEIKKRRTAAERETKKLEQATLRANRLTWGETLEHDLVSKSWHGFKFCVELLRGAERRKVFSIKIAAKHRSGDNFSRNRYPNKECEPAPGNIRTAVSLFMWCRKKIYVPTTGSEAMEKLFDVFETVSEVTGEALDSLTTDLVDIRKELLDLRKEKWQNVNALNGVKKP